MSHGLSRSPEYAVWNTMLQRCRNPHARGYKRYGAAGVTVCERWSFFVNFIEDMGRRPIDGQRYTIERVDGAKGYEPGNCRWATYTEQARNQKSNRLLTFHGETMPMAAWAERLGIPSASILNRIDNLGWTVERALTTPNDFRPRKKITHNGETLSSAAWAHRTGIPAQRIIERIFKWGWSVEQSLATPIMSKAECGRRSAETRKAAKEAAIEPN